jgi:hypothetical protein
MEKKSKKVTFSLSIEEANVIFKALGNLPFTEVYELIGKLNEQANAQLSQNGDASQSFIHDSSQSNNN